MAVILSNNAPFGPETWRHVVLGYGPTKMGLFFPMVLVLFLWAQSPLKIHVFFLKNKYASPWLLVGNLAFAEPQVQLWFSFLPQHLGPSLLSYTLCDLHLFFLELLVLFWSNRYTPSGISLPRSSLQVSLEVHHACFIDCVLSISSMGIVICILIMGLS